MPYMSGKLLKEKIEQNWKEDAANFFKVILYPIFPILLWKQCGSLVLIHLYKRRDISGFCYQEFDVATTKWRNVKFCVRFC